MVPITRRIKNNKNMEDLKLAMCRVCLADDVRMCLIANTHLQEVYESLTLIPLEAQDRRPVQVCYICYAELQNSYRLRKRSLQSEELLTWVLSSGVLQPVNILESSCTRRLRVVHPVTYLSIGNVQNDTHDETTEDSADKTEAPDVVIDVKVKREDAEVLTDIKNEAEEELAVETDDNIYIDIDIVKSEPDVVDTGTSDLKKHRLATQFSIETTSSKHNRNEQAETTVAEHESVADKPVIISEIQQTIDKVDATLHKRTSENNICLNKTSFRSKSRLQCHTRTHAGEKLFECDVCKKGFTYKCYLIRHMRTHTGQKPYMCDVCNKYFTHNYTLTAHMRTHTGKKLYLCDVCDKHFTIKGNFINHMRTHTGEKPYICDVCNKRFSLKGDLTKHMRTHTGEKPYLCDVCSKRFTQNCTLTAHMRTHTGEKPYMCDVCKKCFSESNSLKNHLRIHTGEKPYLCDVCKKSFSERKSLKRHMRTHTGEKPYICDVCNKRFSIKGDFIKHMRIHTGKKRICE